MVSSQDQQKYHLFGFQSYSPQVFSFLSHIPPFSDSTPSTNLHRHPWHLPFDVFDFDIPSVFFHVPSLFGCILSVWQCEIQEVG